MSWNGSGIFNPAITFVPNTPATAEDQNTQDVDIAGGITNCMAKDGQNAATNNLSMGGFKLTNVANGVVSTDAATFGQLGAFVPPGIVLPYAGVGAVPGGYLLCNGQAVSQTTYAALYAIIGGEYGSGAGTFNVPNLQGRVIAGVDPGQTNLSTFSINDPTVAGGVGGTQGHVLSVAELASHGHAVNINDPGHAHTYFEGVGGAAGGAGVTGFAGNVPAATTTVTTGVNSSGTSNVGSNASHLNVQPTMTLYYIIKT